MRRVNAYAHFRFDMEQDDEVLYVYELQLEKEVRRQGERYKRSGTVSSGKVSAISRMTVYQCSWKWKSGGKVSTMSRMTVYMLGG